MRFVVAVLTIALMAVPAYAKGKRQSGAQPQNEEAQKKAQELDKEYKASLSRIPEQKPADPWGTMR